MKRLKIYIDTSVIGGYFDEEFQEKTKPLFDEIIKGNYQVVISDLTEKELLKAPENVRTLLHKLKIKFELIIVTTEGINLANEYINEQVVGKTSLDDCIHIATATIQKVDILVSWNFKHIVNLQRIKGYNGINLKKGYSTLEIRSPQDLINYEEK